MAETQIKRKRQEVPDFERIRKLQRLNNISDYDLAIAAGYSGMSPAANMANAERVGYWQTGKSKKLQEKFGWDLNEILPNARNTKSETHSSEAEHKELPVCDCVSSSQSAMFLGQINEQMLVLNHMMYELCKSLDVKLKIKVGDFRREN